jgi:hypothetical protein
VFHVDTEKPLLETPDLPDPVNGAYSLDFNASDMFNVSGNVSVYGNEEIIYSKNLSRVESSNFSVRYNFSEAEPSEVEVLFMATDKAGNTAKENTSLEIDAQAPDPELQDQEKFTDSVEPEVSVSEDVVNRSYRVWNGSSVSDWLDSGESYEVDEWSGNLTLELQATDEAGLTGRENFSITVDNSDPEVTYSVSELSSMQNGWVKPGVKIQASCKDRYVKEFYWEDSESEDGDLSFTLDEQGIYEPELRCEDMAGNLDENGTQEFFISEEDPGFESPWIFQTGPNFTGRVNATASFENPRANDPEYPGINSSASKLSTDEGSIDSLEWTNSSLQATIGEISEPEIKLSGRIVDLSGREKSFSKTWDTPLETSKQSGSEKSPPQKQAKTGERSTQQEDKLRSGWDGRTYKVLNFDLAPGREKTLPLSNSATAFRSLIMDGNGQIDLHIRKVGETLSGPGGLETYTMVNTELKGSVISSKLTFTLPVSWHTRNDLRPEKTSLYLRQGGNWEAVDTDLVDTNSRVYKYSSEPSEFGTFAVAAKRQSCIKKNYSVIQDGSCRTVRACEPPAKGHIVNRCEERINTSGASLMDTETPSTNASSIRLPEVKIEKYSVHLFGFGALAFISLISYMLREWYRDLKYLESVRELKSATKDPEMLYVIDGLEKALSDRNYSLAAERMKELKRLLSHST